MLLKCCTQYASKFGKLSSGHRSGKGQFSLQSQRRPIPKNIQTTTQLNSFHMLVHSCSKSSKLGFNRMWTENFQMFKLDLEKAEELEIKYSNSCWIIGKAREFWKNIYFCFIDYVNAFDCVNHKKLWKILQELGISDHLTCLMRNLYAGQEATVKTKHETTGWFKIGKGVCQACILSHCLFNLYAE